MISKNQEEKILELARKVELRGINITLHLHKFLEEINSRSYNIPFRSCINCASQNGCHLKEQAVTLIRTGNKNLKPDRTQPLSHEILSITAEFCDNYSIINDVVFNPDN